MSRFLFLKAFFLFVFMFINVSAYATEDGADEQIRLDSYAKQLSEVEQALDGANLTPEKLVQFYDTTDNILNQAQLIKEESSIKIKKSQETLQALTTPSVATPAADAVATKEDPATAKRRKELEALTALYDGRIKQANAIMAQARAIFEEITQRRIELKTQTLVQRDVMINPATVLQRSFAEVPDAIDLFGQWFMQAWQNFLTHTDNLVGLSLCALSFIFAYLLSVPARRYANNRFERKNSFASLSSVNHIRQILYYVLTNGLLPALAISLLALPFLVSNLISNSEVSYLRIFMAPIFLLFLSLSFFQICLTPKQSHWRLFNLTPRSAATLLTRIRPFIALLSLNLFLYLVLKYVTILPDATLMFQFGLRLAICINGLFLLSSKCWHTNPHKAEETANFMPATGNRRFYKFVRAIGFTIFVTNPILIFIGYTALANALFASFLKTFVLWVVFFAVHHLINQLCAGVLGLHNGVPHHYLQRFFDFKARNAKTTYFWVMVLVDAILYLCGGLTLLVIWGLDTRYLASGLEMLWYGIEIGGNNLSLLSLSIGIAVFVVLFSVTRFIQRILSDKVFPHTSLDLGAQHALKTGLGYIGFLIAIILSVSSMGFDLSKLAIVLGALSVGIGFGLQNIVSNFVSGIILLIERPIKLGDRLIVGVDEGVVTRISVRATEIRTFDRTSILVPNSELISGRVQNRTLRDTLSRIEVKVGVAYSSPAREVKQLLLDIAKEHPDVLDTPEPNVLFSDFADSSLTFLLRVYLDDIDKRSEVASDLRFRIDEVFREHNISIPFPQREVWIHQ